MQTVSIFNPTLQRITIVDALRGFALFGIILAHMADQFFIGEHPATKFIVGTHPFLDMLAAKFIDTFVTGKFFTIFSLLFGLSFFIQMDRAHQKGKKFLGKFCWRLTILFAFGIIHSFFYGGDILTIYASLGFLLVLFYTVDKKYILIAVLILTSGIHRFFVVGYREIFHKEQTEQFRTVHKQDMLNYFDVLSHGSLSEVVQSNLKVGLANKADFQFGFGGRAYQTFALFLLGLLIGRSRFFEQTEKHKMTAKKYLRSFLIATFCILIALFIFKELQKHIPQLIAGLAAPWQQMIIENMNDWLNLTISGTFITIFILVYQIKLFNWILSRLEFYGRMGLSNYIIQTIFGIILFYGIGYGLLGQLSTTFCTIIGIGFFLLQVVISRFWLTYFKYGPLEWIWRSGTNLSWQPLLKNRK